MNKIIKINNTTNNCVILNIIIWQTQSLCSDWFFLGQDFAVPTVSMETVQPLERSRQIQNLQPKQRKKNCE